MVVESIPQFAAKKNFKQLAKTVRKNTNGFLFVTFIDAENKAENVYFSKTASENVKEDMPVAEAIKGMQIGYTTNEAGEERIKLISNSERVDIASLFE